MDESRGPSSPDSPQRPRWSRLKRERSPVRGDSERQKDQTLEDISDISDDDNVGCIRDGIGIENSGNVRSSPAEGRSRSPKFCRREGRKPMEAPNAKRNKVKSPEGAYEAKVLKSGLYLSEKGSRNSKSERSKGERKQSKHVFVPQVSEHPGCHVIFIGRIFTAKPADLKDDIEILLRDFGNVKETFCGNNFAKVHIECDRQTAEDLIKSLDWTEWKGNKIRVRFSMVRRSRDFTMGLEKTVEEKSLSDVESFKPEDMIVLDEVTGSPSRSLSPDKRGALDDISSEEDGNIDPHPPDTSPSQESPSNKDKPTDTSLKVPNNEHDFDEVSSSEELSVVSKSCEIHTDSPKESPVTSKSRLVESVSDLQNGLDAVSSDDEGSKNCLVESDSKNQSKFQKADTFGNSPNKLAANSASSMPSVPGAEDVESSSSSVINDGLEDVSEGGDDGVSDVSCDEFPSAAAISSPPPPTSSIPQAPPPPNISGEGGCGNTYTGFSYTDHRQMSSRSPSPEVSSTSMSGTISSQLPSFRPQSIQSASCHNDDQSDSDLSDTPIVMDSITPVSALRNPYD